MELHEFISQMLGDSPEFLSQLRIAADNLNIECMGTVPYETDVLKDAFGVCLCKLVWCITSLQRKLLKYLPHGHGL